MRCPYCGEEDVGDTTDEAWDNHIRDCNPIGVKSA